MLRLIGTYEIPDWAIPYLVNGDSEGLSEEEISTVDYFVDSLIIKYNATHVDFDIVVMNEEKYGNHYHTELNSFPAFGRVFGATETWMLPVWIGTDNEKEEEDCWCKNCQEHVKLLTLPELWKRLSHVPVNSDDEIEDCFLGFPPGTSKFDVWHWFDERCPNNLHDDLMFPKSK